MSRDTSKCIQAIRDASGGKLSRDDAEDRVNRVLSRANNYMKTKGLSEPDALAKAAEDHLTEESIALAKQRANSLRNMQKRINNTNISVDTAEALKNPKKGITADDIAKGIKVHLTGINSHTDGGRLGVFQMQQAVREELVSGFGNELTQTGLTKVAQDGKKDFAIVQELHALSGGEGVEPGISKDPQAQKVAGVMSKYLKLGVKALNDQGANIKDLAGYVVHQTHDWLKIRNAGVDWKADVANWIDPVKTRNSAGVSFGDMDKIEQSTFLDNIHKSLVSGEHFAGGGVGLKEPVFRGPGNMAKSASQSRLLHFAGAENTYNYMKKYGSEGSVLEGVLNSISAAARQSGMMRVFGTNPEAEFGNLTKRVMQHYVDSDPESLTAVREFREKKLPGLQSKFDELIGKNDQPRNEIAANIGQTVRLFENITKLGRVPFAHLSVGATRGLADNNWGMSTLSSYKNTLTAAFKYNKFALNDEDKQLLGRIKAYNDAQIGSVTSGYGTDFSGKVATVNNMLMKLTGFPQFMAWQKMSAKVATSRIVGEGLDKSFEKLHPGMQGNLASYGINSKEWDMLRSVPNVATKDGDKFFTADMADQLDPEQVKSYLQDKNIITERTSEAGVNKAVEQYKQDLGTNIAALHEEEARRALNIPGVDTKMLLFGNSKRGTIGGELRRLVTQFKQWPTELILNTYGRAAYASGSTGQATFNIIKVAALASFAGYLRMSCNAITSGKDVPDPSDPAVMGEAFAQGGAGTIMLEQLIATGKQRDFKGVAESILGPAAGEAIEGGVDVAHAAKGGNLLSKGDQERWQNLAGGDLSKPLPRQIPGQNLWWMNLVQNHILNHVFHTMNQPGWDERYNQSLQAAKPVLQPK